MPFRSAAISGSPVYIRIGRLLGILACAIGPLAGCTGSPPPSQAIALPQSAGLAAGAPEAVPVGQAALQAGGTAADAVVAMAFMTAVTLPSRAGLGGGGVCVIHDPATATVRTLDFLPRAAPGGGPAVPALVRGLALLQATYGKTRWPELVGPAEARARFGAPVSRALAADLAAAGAGPAGALFGAGASAGAGATLSQPALAAVLSAVRERGVAGFYQGRVAAEVASGLGIDPSTLAAYRPVWRDPVAVPVGDDVLEFAGLPGSPAATAWQAVAGASATPGAIAAALPAVAEAPPTVGLAVVDANEQSVACALTMGGSFGTGRLMPGTGMFAAVPAAGAGIAGPVLDINTNRHLSRLAAVGSNEPGADGRAAGTALDTVLAGLYQGNQPLRAAEAAPRGPGEAGRVQAVRCEVGRYMSSRDCQAETDPRGFGATAGIAR